MDTQPNEPDALIAFACPGCGHAMKARASYAGRATRCPTCQASVTVPAPEARPKPTAKKSSAGRYVAIGAGLLFLAGGVALAFLLMRGKDDIDDFALVPPNAQGIVCVKFDALWKTPAVQKMAERYARANPGKPDLARRLEAETGLKPDEIERVTVVVANAAKEEGWAVVKTKKPYDAEAIRERVKAAPMRRVDFADERIDPEVPLAFEAVSPRVFVLGKEAGVRQALDLPRSPLSRGPLGPVIERCRQADHVVFGYNPAAGRIDGGNLGVDLSVLNDVDVVLGTLNIREQAELEVRARTDDAAKAERLHVATTGWLKTAKFGLAFAQFDPGEKGKQAKQISKILGAIKLDVDDKDVVATLKTDADAALAQLLGVIP